MKKKFWTKQNIIIVVICVILVAAIITVSVVLSELNKKEQTAEASVARGSLSNNVNSSGTIVETGISGSVPLYACVEGVTDMDVLEDYDSNFSWSSYIFDAVRNETPLMYYVGYANPAMRGTRNYFHTSDESEIIFTASPMTLNTEKLVEDYEAAKASGEITSDIALYDFFFLVILGSGADNPGDIPVKYLQSDISKTVVVTTAYLKELIEVNASPEETDSFEYTITNFSLKEDDVVSLDKRVFNFAVSQLYTTFTVTEYDVASIDAKLREAEKLTLEDGKKHGVYAAVSINALDGRKVVAEILSVVKGSNSGGISYYAVQAKIIFASTTELDLTVEENRSLKVARSALQKDPDATSVVCGDYTYYDPELTPEAVEALDVDLADSVLREEVLVNYSVSVRVQKTVVYNKLIVPTKCIFYDGSKQPYVIVKDGNKETRVYIKILLSTGSEAAVEVNEGYSLEEGDKIVYQADSGLISSILG